MKDISVQNLTRRLSESPSFRFVLIMGVVNLFGDTTYSGGASMNGLLLGSLGASAAIISITGGLSQFIGFLTRAISGYISDKIGKHCLIVFLGYTLNLFAVPALALAGQWQIASGLILLQGIGSGLRKPILQAMLSYTTAQHGRGWVYGVYSALDELGRAIGPLIIALVLAMGGAFRLGYVAMLIPAALALLILTVARIGYPVPSRLNQESTATKEGFTAAYWLYLAAGVLFAAGVTSIELISFHLSKIGVPRQVVPLYLVLATVVGAFSSLGFGKLYDRMKIAVVLGAVFLTAMFSPFVFLLSSTFALVGMVLWGIGQMTQDALLSSVVSTVLPKGRRDLAFGLYFAGYGAGWLIGAVAAGLLYQQSHIALVVFVGGVQLLSLPLFALAARRS